MAVPFKVKAVFEYSSPHDDDLNFPNGQIITVTEAEDDDWYTGEYTDASGTKQEGLFPRNFVEKYEPEIPSRPTRHSRPKKETEAAPPPLVEEVPSVASPVESPVEHDQKDLEEVPQEPEAEAVSQPPIAAAPPVEEEEVAAPRQAQQAPVAVKSPPLPTATKPPPSKSGPPPVAEKPTGNSFRDRIAAFNKPSAAPIAPFKPGSSSGSSGFIKKPFVAPPPSRNAYVPPPREPPQKVYRREQDETELAKPPPPPAAKAVEPEVPTEEDQPKPTSLKDRIALLQKQQLEQAARQAEAAQKKEKPKRPPKKRIESQEQVEQAPAPEETDLQRIDTSKTIGKGQASVAEDEGEGLRSPTVAPQVSVASPPPPSRELVSDTNDADDSEDAAGLSTGREDDGEQLKLPVRSMSMKAQPAPESTNKESDEADEEDEGEEEEEEDEDIDPEIKRRMEIRERMAKMSGGMGMMGMFGGGMPMSAPARKSKPSGDHTRAPPTTQEQDQPAARAPPVPLMALPGMSKTRSSEEAAPEMSVEHEEGNKTPNLASSKAREAVDVPDIEDVEEPVADETPEPRSPQAHLPPPPPSRNAPPMTPGEMADDEMSFAASRTSLGDSARPQSKDGIAPAARQPPPPPPSVPARRTTQDSIASATSPVTPSSQEKRMSRGPPPLPPTAAPVSSPQTRAPPPPPPGPPSRTGTTVSGKHQGDIDDEEDEEEEVTEYDGDYDTDIAPGAEHKDALKAHERDSSVDEDTPVEETLTPPSTQSGRGPPPLPPVSAPRNVPPPPPSGAPKHGRQSSDMPRAAPPPVPPLKEASMEADEGDYDPFNYSRSPPLAPPRNYPPPMPDAKTPMAYDDDMYTAPPMTTRAPPPPPPPAEEAFPRSSVERTAPPPPPTIQAPQAVAPQPPRQSTDVPVQQGGRRSMDQSRPSVEHGFIASDIDIAPSTFWWTQPNLPPPSLQSRTDILYEMESNTSTKRGGKASTTTDIYVLYMDYSQSTISLTFDPSNPSDYSVDQRHERPPTTLRQDQLEAASSEFGSKLASAAESKQNATVGNGTPHALVLELVSAMPAALKPVGNRAFGALIYGNLANASVQQFDEIRPGDIVTFRNAKFQGHRGTMHQKYALDLTKSGPDHVGIVVDWDGTKKKIRAWEQGRESKKVKVESFKLGDLRSGECRVWRVMNRKWVGWDSGS